MTFRDLSTNKLAVIVAIVAETLLAGIAALFGQIGPCSWNDAMGAVMLFHLPGIFFSMALFPDHQTAVWITVIFFGFVQFFILSWVTITLWRKI